jgi:Protein of unknown function (DUF1345)
MMDAVTVTKPPIQPLARKRVLLRSVPVFLALLAIGVINYIVSAQFSLGPRGLTPGLIGLLVLALAVAIRSGQVRISRTVSILLLGVVTVAEAISTSVLIVSLVTAPVRMSDVLHTSALLLLRDGALLWLVNVLTFSFWYWELDGGGASRRHHTGYQSTDFTFPQATLECSGECDWVPHYIDYLFLAFNTSTAYSPTDTQVLSIRIKLLMMIQSLTSLTLLTIIAARAVNTL